MLGIKGTAITSFSSRKWDGRMLGDHAAGEKLPKWDTTVIILLTSKAIIKSGNPECEFQYK
jgi:hypothetical protein